MVSVASGELEEFTRQVLLGVGATHEAADEVAAHLVRADASGHGSHGVRALPGYVSSVRAGRLDPRARVETVADYESIVVLDGQHGFGPVTGRAGAALAEERAGAHGIACVLARNAGHLGRLGEYTEGLADRNVASIMLVNAQGGGQRIAPHGGVEARLANNPVSLGFPGRPQAAILDMALSTAAARRIERAKERGDRLPEGWISDAAGNPTTDPDDYLEGGGLMTPVGGSEGAHKGYGMIVLVELLVGVLSGGGVCGGEVGSPGENAYLLIAIDVGRVVPTDTAHAQFRALRDHVRSSARLPGTAEILLPGERSAEARRRSAANGIAVDAATWEALEELAALTDVALPAVGA